MSAGGPLVVVGDALLDRDVDGSVERLSPDAPVPVVDEGVTRARPGGAGLAALLAAADGRPVTLVTALAERRGGPTSCAALLEAAGVDVVDLGLDGTTPEKIRITTGGRPLLRLDRGGEHAVRRARRARGRARRDRLGRGVLVADYGRGVAAQPAVREALGGARAARRSSGTRTRAARRRRPAPRSSRPTWPRPPALVPEPAGDGLREVAAARPCARRAAGRAGHVCVTWGARGAVLQRRRRPAARRGRRRPRPAATRAARATASPAAPRRVLAAGASVHEPCRTRSSPRRASSPRAAPAPSRARASRCPARPASVPAPVPRPAIRSRSPAPCAPPAGRSSPPAAASTSCTPATSVRSRRRGRSATASSCCLNSDASVRRLKGDGRPVVAQDDRAAVLRALRCVDAVIVFDEDTPVAALERLLPDVWAKGGDYAGRDLPEAAALARWGGEVVVLPYLAGRSSTRLIEEALPHAIR